MVNGIAPRTSGMIEDSTWRIDPEVREIRIKNAVKNVE